LLLNTLLQTAFSAILPTGSQEVDLFGLWIKASCAEKLVL